MIGAYNEYLTGATIHFMEEEPLPPMNISISTDYRSSVTHRVEKSFVPDGSVVEWTVSGGEYLIATSEDTTICMVTFLGRGEYTITASVDGETVYISEKYNVQYTWWQWIIVILLFGWIWY